MALEVLAPARHERLKALGQLEHLRAVATDRLAGRLEQHEGIRLGRHLELLRELLAPLHVREGDGEPLHRAASLIVRFLRVAQRHVNQLEGARILVVQLVQRAEQVRGAVIGGLEVEPDRFILKVTRRARVGLRERIEGLAQHVHDEAALGILTHLEVLVAVEEHLEGILAPDIREVLAAQLVVLHALRLHRVDDEPGRNILERLNLAHDPGGIVALHLAQLALDELLHLGDHEHGDALPDADAAHPVSALRELAEHHVLSEREGRARGERVLDVHARRVDLVVEGEALLEADATL